MYTITGIVHKEMGNVTVHTMSVDNQNSLTAVPAENGRYNFSSELLSGTSFVYAVPVEGYGTVFTPNAAISVDGIIRPPRNNGFQYVCTQAGTLPSSEPATWVVTAGETITLGSAQFTVTTMPVPLVNGPAKGKPAA